MVAVVAVAVHKTQARAELAEQAVSQVAQVLEEVQAQRQAGQEVQAHGAKSESLVGR